MSDWGNWDEGFSAGQDSLTGEIAALRAEVERLREHLRNAERIGTLGYPMHRTIDNHDGMLFVIRAALRGEEGT